MLLKVKTNYGYVEGCIVNDSCTLFKGIPYAAPPIGERRFREPIPPTPWEGVRECDTWGNACPQSFHHTPDSPYGIEFYTDCEYPPQMNEDCLYLNIWTPASASDDKLPVMMWIHGGGVQDGYGHEMEFDGEALTRRGVILITINYRLNIFGFFCHPELTAESPHHACGNYGIMDQIQALHWIKENINAFGGDPENIMVFGQSGGGRSTQALSCSPLTKGLIQHAAIHSAGGVLTGFGRLYRKQLEERGVHFCQMNHISSLSELRTLPWQELRQMFMNYHNEAGMHGGFNICADGYVLPLTLEDSVLTGVQHDIDYIIGCTIDEILHNFGDSKVNMAASQRAWGRCQYMQGKKPAYMFCFDRPLPGIRENAFINTAFHSAELWYVFGTLKRCWRPFSKEDYQLSELMMDYWTNFAKTGNPNSEKLPNWEPFTEPAKEMLDFSIDGTKMKAFDLDGMMVEMEDFLMSVTDSTPLL